MLRGLLGGLFWGAIISGVIAAVFLIMSDVRLLSQPTVSQSTVQTPAVDQTKAQSTAELGQIPSETTTVGSADPAQTPVVSAPEAPETTALPRDVTESATRPEAIDPDTALAAPVDTEADSGISLTATADALVDGSDGPIPSIPAADAPLDVQQSADAPAPFAEVAPAPESPEIDPVFAESVNEANIPTDSDSPAMAAIKAPENLTPEAESGELEIVTASTEPEKPVVVQRSLPQITAPAPDADLAPAMEKAETVDPSAKFQTAPNRIATNVAEDSLPTVKTDRLPRIGVNVPTEAPVLNAPLEVVDISTLPALEAYGVPFNGDETLPKYAVVLIDDGSGAIDPMAFADFPIPLAFAIDAARSDAASAAYDYRRAGFEVVLLTRLPTGATPGDIEVAFEAYHAVLPEAVAMLDTGESGFQDDRNLIRQVAMVAKERGQGILAFSQGLNAVKQVADREEVPSAIVFRNFDSDGQSVTTMKRYLNRAAFKAAQEGHVVMVGHTRADTIKALVEWVLDDKSNSVALAPVSAILLDQ